MATIHDRMALILISSHTEAEAFEVGFHDRQEAQGVGAALERLGCAVTREPDGVTLVIRRPADGI